MRPLVVVVHIPFSGLPPHLIDGAEDVCVQHRPAVASVEALDVAVLGRLHRLGEQYLYVVAMAPLLEVP